MKFTNILNYIKISLKSILFFFKTFGIRATFYKFIDYIEYHVYYNRWYSNHTTSSTELSRQRSYLFKYSPLISIIVPVYKTPSSFLREMIDSVIAQTYSHWELCIADGSADTTSSYIAEIIRQYQLKYPNIKYIQLTENLGISGNTNAALKLASGEYIGLLDHDDFLSPDALYEIVSTLNNKPTTDIIYTDEDKTNLGHSSFYGPYFKPDFNLDLLRSCNYITHFYIVKKKLVDQVNGFSEDCNGSQDYDFILKTCDLTKNIVHIPKILYHWRIHPASVAGNPENKTYAYDSAIRALQAHLDRNGEIGHVEKGDTFGYYRITYKTTSTPLISLYLKDCSSDLLDKIKNNSDFSNIQIITSLDQVQGEYTIILYRIKEILTYNWIKPMLENCSRPNVGIVSGKTFLNKTSILEYGLVHDTQGQLFSPFYKHPIKDTGYCFRAHVQHNCNYVSPFCVMTKSELLKEYFPIHKNISFQEQHYEFCYELKKNNLLITLLPNVTTLCSHLNYSLPQLPYCADTQDSCYNPNFSVTKPFSLTDCVDSF